MTGVLFYTGFFDPLKLSQEECGPFKLIYREYCGQYGAVRLIVKQVAKSTNDTLRLTPRAGFTLFYDSPLSSLKSLRCICGIISDTIPDSLPDRYKSGVFDRTKAFTGRFPVRSFFSYETGSYKFYKALSRLIEEKNIHPRCPVMEIYEPQRRLIRFVVPAESTGYRFPSFPPN